MHSRSTVREPKMIDVIRIMTLRGLLAAAVAALVFAAAVGAQSTRSVSTDPRPTGSQGRRAPVRTTGTPSMSRGPQQPLARTPAPLMSKPLGVPLRQISVLSTALPADLTGFGIVTGLDKTGSGGRLSRQALANLVKRFGINTSVEDLSPGSVAVVSVSATLPAFAKVGTELDVHVSAVGDESDLRGGRLLPVKLLGWDGKTYAIASGPVFVNGFKAESADSKASVRRNHVTAGSVANGGRVVVALDSTFLTESGHLELRLRNPSINTVVSAAASVNKMLKSTRFRAVAVDSHLLRLVLPEKLRTEQTALQLLNRIGNAMVEIRGNAKVILNETSGLIIAGENVQISPCVIAVSNLTISVVSEDEVVQPLPGFSQGETAIVSRSRIDVAHDKASPRAVGGGGATVGELVANLKQLNLDPQELIEVFKHLRAMGYLHAELIVR